MKWLITGGCGFIGSALAHKLAAMGGQQIRIIDNLSVGQPSALKGLEYMVHEAQAADALHWSKTADLVACDILDSDALIKAASDADVVVHLAANTGVQPSIADPHMDCLNNVVGTQNCLEAARKGKVKRFVFASSGAPVGEVTPPIHEEIVPHPVSPYGASKLSGEAYCSAYYHAFGLETVALRFGNVYGTGSAHKTSVVARFCTAILDGEPLTIYGDGTQTRDFVALDDLLDAILAATTRPDIGGEVFQIATSSETTVSEIARMLLEIAARRGLVAPGMKQKDRLAGDVMRNFSDTRKAERLLGWRSKTELAHGLAETLDWFIAARKGTI